jgi:hypothetical protein
LPEVVLKVVETGGCWVE